MDPTSAGYYAVNHPVMQCGHISNALYTEEDGTKISVCSDCLKSKPVESKTIADLEGRIAVCKNCGSNPVSSSPVLFDFFYTGKNFDTYYDGCLG